MRAASAPTRAPSSSRSAYECARGEGLPIQKSHGAMSPAQPCRNRHSSPTAAAQRRGEIGIPIWRLTADARAVTGKADERGDRIDPHDLYRVVDGVVVVDTIDAHAGHAAGPRADPHRDHALGGAIHRARDQLGQELRVALVLRGLRSPRHATAAQRRRAVGVRGVEQHGVLGDAKHPLDARPYRVGQRASDVRQVDRHDRGAPAGIVLDDQRLRQ